MSATTVVADTAEGMSSTAVFLSLLVTALTFAYAYYRIKNKRFFELADKIPGPPTLPIIGNALMFRHSAHGTFKVLQEYGEQRQYDTIVRFWFGPRLVVFIADPADVEVSFFLNPSLLAKYFV